jgi:hypothetical protein
MGGRRTILRQAWRCAYSEDDDSWIEREIERYRRQPDGPYAGIGRALERLLALGADRRDLVELARGAQATMLFGVAYLLNDPGLSGDEVEEVRNLGWALVETDEDWTSTDREIGCLHESVLETDPTRREMRPRPD